MNVLNYKNHSITLGAYLSVHRALTNSHFHNIEHCGSKSDGDGGQDDASTGTSSFGICNRGNISRRSGDIWS